MNLILYAVTPNLLISHISHILKKQINIAIKKDRPVNSEASSTTIVTIAPNSIIVALLRHL